MPLEDIERRASKYALMHGLELADRLGHGVHGTVFSTSQASAVKIHRERAAFERELACYERLKDLQVVELRGHHVPQLIAWDDSLWIIEMTVVARPYLLDFAGAFLDSPPDFSDEVMEQWYDEMQELFEDRWEDVQLLLAELRGRCGIHLVDVNRGNVAFDLAQ